MKSRKRDNAPSLITMLRFLTTRRDKVALIGLFGLTIVLSFVETLSISLIMPFISMASNPAFIHSTRVLNSIYDYIASFMQGHGRAFDEIDFIFLFGFSMIGFYIFRLAFNMLYSFASNLFMTNKYRSLTLSLFERALCMPYLRFVDSGQESVRNNIMANAQAAARAVQSALSIGTELCVFVTLYAMLIAINYKMTIVLSIIIILEIIILLKTVTKKITRVGKKRTTLDKKVYEILSKTFGNFILFKLSSKVGSLRRLFEATATQRSRIEVVLGTLSPVPKLTLETVGFMLMILAIMYVLYRYDTAAAVIPVISMYALALYRLMPSITRMMTFYNEIKTSQYSVRLVYDELTTPLPSLGTDPIIFERDICLQNISFKYSSGNAILKDFSMRIQKGQSVAFTGPSGAGKSTLINIIIGIITEYSGEILIDGVRLSWHNLTAWRNKIGYIPQQIYLFNGTIAQNITFGGKFDKDKIVHVCKIAKIYDYIAQYDGIFTMVGEGGLKLSGGQRQRIGIARALYHDPEILVLDEATSALDTATESAIMDEIYEIAKDKTLFIIAHRISTTKRCDVRVEVDSLTGNS